MGKNFVIIVSDSLRAQNLSFYGYDRDTAPFLTEMAEENTYLENYYSNAIWTIPAHASIFTGKLPSSHGANTTNPFFKGENKLEEYFSKKGYETFCISENSLITPKFGFGESFDNHISDIPIRGEVYEEVVSKEDNKLSMFSEILFRGIFETDLRSLKNLGLYPFRRIGLSHSGEKYNQSYSDRTMEEVIESIENRNEDDFFLFLNLMNTHFDYTFREEDRKVFLDFVSEEKIKFLTDHGGPKQWTEKYRDLDQDSFEIIRSAYDCSIRYTDFLIENLYDKLPDETVFIVLGDHGEVIGEHELGGIPINEHQFGTFQENIKVPFIAFPHEGDFEKGAYSHQDFIDLIKSIDTGRSVSPRKSVFSEYYGIREMWNILGYDIPSKLEDLVERKSFSVIDEDYKLDLIFEKERYKEELRNLENLSLFDSESKIKSLKGEMPATMKFMIQDLKD